MFIHTIPSTPCHTSTHSQVSMLAERQSLGSSMLPVQLFTLFALGTKKIVITEYLLHCTGFFTLVSILLLRCEDAAVAAV